jgi:hypothetical protein
MNLAELFELPISSVPAEATSLVIGRRRWRVSGLFHAPRSTGISL